MDERDRLLAAIAADPDAVENWLVYADWLSERDDPRGELINLELAIEAGTTDAAVVVRHRALMRDEDALVSPRLFEEVHHLELAWRRGFVRAARVFGAPDDPPTAETLAALFADPHACVLEQLTLVQCAPVVADVCSTSLRRLELVGIREVDLPLAAAFPRLDQLAFGKFEDVGHEGKLEHLGHPTLREIVGYCAALSTGAFELPALAKLSVAFISSDKLFAPRAILMNPPPSLVELSMWCEDVVTELRTSPVLAQLRTLSIQSNPAEIEALAADPGPFGHLALTCTAAVETVEERDELRGQIATVFPTANIDISASEDFSEPDEAPEPTVNPVPIGDLFTRLAERIRRRKSEDA